MKLNFGTVLFDFDGTLFDSSEGIFKSLKYAFRADNKPEPTDGASPFYRTAYI